MVQPLRVAYFSMEIGLESGMPTYAGGLGVLAGARFARLRISTYRWWLCPCCIGGDTFFSE